jgi:hypothetical protein
VSGFDAGVWDKAEAGGDNQPPGVGTFEVAVDELKAFTSKQGNDIVVVNVRDLQSGSMWSVLGSFKSPGAVGMTKELCSSLGADVSEVGSLEELNERLQAAVGGFFKVEVERNGEFWNTYFRHRIESDVPAEVSQAVAAAKADDDIPF